MSIEIIKGTPSTMMDEYQLNVMQLIKHAGTWFKEQEIVSRKSDGSIHRYNYGEALRRVRRMAKALKRLGLKVGDRVGVLSWNTFRYYESYFSIPAIGAIMVELNPRLHITQLSRILTHSKVSVIFVDELLIPLAESLSSFLKVDKYVIMSDKGRIEARLPKYYDYEELLSSEDDDYEFPMFDERTACYAAYTTGTTGDPKGIYYSHRSIMLNVMVASRNVTVEDTVLQLVPMFHVNGWLLHLIATMVGAKLILPGRYTTENPEPLVDLMIKEKVTIVAGVPEIFSAILDYLRKMKEKPNFTGSRALIGGSEPPLSLMLGLMEFGFTVGQGYGTTETTPAISGSVLKPKVKEKLSPMELVDILRRQGVPAFGIEIKVVDPETGKEVPHDGKTVGEIWVRGFWVAKEYYNDPRTLESFVGEGVNRWWRTGDLGVIDEFGYLKVVDRIKDVIKSGGEWISTVDLENAIMNHPAIKEATVIGVPHPKWGERPLAFVVVKEGHNITKEEILEFLKNRFAKWQLPDDIIFMNDIPKTSVGKFDKKVLREKYKDYFMKKG
jgi:fatty-acyl-CoA synthase